MLRSSRIKRSGCLTTTGNLLLQRNIDRATITKVGARELSVAEVANLAEDSSSRREFRDEVMRRLRRTIGYDAGWFHTLDPSLPLDSGCWDSFDMTTIERARASWGVYGPQLVALRSAMSASRGVAQDTDVYSARQRERVPWFTDIVRPLGMKHMVWTGLQLRGRELAVIGMARADGGRGFAHASQELLRDVVPALALAESFLGLRRSPPPDAELTPKEREVLEWFGHGSSYQEVARILHISINTVRQHVRKIYEKLHVSSKVEAVLKLRSK
jgi:DNA-binding CsgD family transcriptional regulator